jgi:Ser/Thr protein kinase RdoA (MazF antagonist)
MKSWSLDSTPVLIRQSANEVYRASLRGEEVYVRVTFAEHRSREEIEAEVEWMLALRAASLSVVRPVVSQNGRYVEESRVGDRLGFVIVLARAPGRWAQKPRDCTPAIARNWGRLMADFHRQSQTYCPAGQARRPSWVDDQVFQLARQAAETGSQQEHVVFRQSVERLRTLDRSPDTFGLTHADLHLGNLSVDGEQVTAFDFDDACYHWFAHDVAVAVTSLRKAEWEAPGAFDRPAVERALLAGYAERGDLRPIVPIQLEAFVQFRIALSACWADQSERNGALDRDMQDWFRRSLPWWRSQLDLAPVG